MIEYFQNDSAEVDFKVSLLGLMILTLSSLSLRPRSRGNGDDDGNSISGEALISLKCEQHQCKKCPKTYFNVHFPMFNLESCKRKLLRLISENE